MEIKYCQFFPVSKKMNSDTELNNIDQISHEKFLNFINNQINELIQVI
jgi:hypothetical protein